MESITEAQVRHMFTRFVNTAKKHGAIAADAVVLLDGGNRTYRYQYRIRLQDSGRTILTYGQDGLGCTKREAYNALKFACYAFDMLPEPK